jgi:magnesium transporter
MAIYREGLREDIPGDISDAFDAARAKGKSFLWIGLHEPTQQEFDLIKDELELHPLAVEDAVDAHQRPKLEHYGDTLFVVLKTLHYVEKTHVLEIGEIMVFAGPDFAITVRHGKANPLATLRTRVENDPELLSAGSAGVLYAVCDEVVDTYSRISHHLEADIIEVEHRVFQPNSRDLTEAIYALKRQTLEFRTAQDPLIPVLEEIVRGRVQACEDVRDYFRDVRDHLLRVGTEAAAHSEILTNVLTAHLALIAMQQNTDVRKISAWAAIIAIPTMVVGVYGMNFEHMPELKWTYGYAMVMTVIAIACTLLYHRLHKSGWL